MMGPSAPALTLEDGEVARAAMQALVKGELNAYYPEVLISYATGRREGDAPGCGPGMLYCKKICELLEAKNIDTFSGLHVPAGTDWKVFLLKLNSRFANCKVLIVVVSPALYESIPCLNEIFDALTSKKGVKIIPVLFENPLPRSDDQWTKVQADDLKAVEMLTRVQKDFGSLNCIPSPPGTVLEQPAVVDRVITMVREHLGKPAPSALSSEPIHTAGVEELVV
eukprot:CAMPEP_0119475376 /NCGR_PEP_ID=MMETSP1344-20130328/6287_1 /TAXON_ID=236787 /ORGANISM="Florenciella parvula, Strain CCMP2471" /LENGTH=223 /DNA_ID=CAMNT_0007508883 /DNA_START=196 /DNA_END=863 /DNA_ORIENTATION=+